MLKERAKESIKFKAKAVIYENETGFKIIAGVAFNAKTGERICKCSMKGQMFDVTDGDEVFATGDWDEHPKYGIGFKMDAYVKIIPQDKKSILWYLKQGNIDGISQKRAEAIVNKFGDNTFDVLIYQTELLQQIKGIGKKSIEKIKKCAKEKLEEQNMIQTIMMYIQGFGISPAYANRIYKRYGLDSIKVINENPYRLADEVKGIGFLKADEIALKNGMPKDSPFRVESAVMYVLKQMSEDGDVFGHREKVEKDCRDFLQLDVSYVENAVKSLIQKKKLICEDDALYLIPLYKAETYAAKKIVELLQSKTKRVNVTKKEVKAMGKAVSYTHLRAHET